MKTPFIRRALHTMLPAVLLLTACGKDDTPAVTPVADTGKVLVVHAAAAANATQLTAFANDQQLGQLNYGQNTSYATVNAGSVVIKANNASVQVSNKTISLAKDQSYSVFAFSPSATIGSIDLLPVSDDLTAPAAGTAKVRIVHLGVGAATPVRLSIPSPIPTGTPTDLTTDVAFGSASPFVAVNASALNLIVTSGTTTRTQQVAVGDGTGTGTGTKTFEAGKIYTVVVRGVSGSGIPAAQQVQAVIVANN